MVTQGNKRIENKPGRKRDSDAGSKCKENSKPKASMMSKNNRKENSKANIIMLCDTRMDSHVENFRRKNKKLLKDSILPQRASPWKRAGRPEIHSTAMMEDGRGGVRSPVVIHIPNHDMVLMAKEATAALAPRSPSSVGPELFLCSVANERSSLDIHVCCVRHDDKMPYHACPLRL